MRLRVGISVGLVIGLAALAWFGSHARRSAISAINQGSMAEVIPLGLDDPSEERLSGLLFRRVDRQGIHCRFEIDDAAISNAVEFAAYGVEIFLDLRPWSKRGRFPYEAGVWHLVFSTDSESGPVLDSKGAGSVLNSRELKQIAYAFSQTERGWDLSLRIPWRALRVSDQNFEDINMAWRLTGSSGQTLGIGASTANKPEIDPILFDTIPVNSSGKGPPKGWLNAREVAINNESHLHVRIVRPLVHGRLPDGAVTFEIGDRHESIRLRYSAGRKFAVAECFLPTIRLVKEDRLRSPLALHASDPNGWSESISLEFPMHAWQRIIRERLPDKTIEALTEPDRRLFVEYLCQMAMDVTEQMTTEPTDRRPRQHQLRSVRDHRYYARIIDFFITKAIDIARYGAPDTVGKYHFWRSRVDGTIQWIKILTPLPPAGNEVAIEFHGKIQEPLAYRDALRLIEDQAGETPMVQGRLITLQLWGRGNRAQSLGEEEFMEAVSLAKRLAKSPRPKIILRGGSMGASDALAYALRHPDLVQALDLRSGFYSHDEKSYANILPQESIVLDNLYAFETQLRRLQHMTGRVLAGDNDEGATAATRLLGQRLSEINKSISVEIVPNAGHSAVSDLPQWLPSWREGVRRTVFANGGIRYLSSSGMRIERIEQFGAPWEIVRDDSGNRSRLQLRTRNVGALSVSRAGGAWQSVSIDEQTFPFVADSSCYEKDAAGKWRAVPAPAPGDRKSTLCSGPIGDIFNRPCVIVYGTLDPDAKDALAARAHRLAQSLSGIYEGGLRYRVLGDGEFDKSIRDRSVWIIGDETQNAAYGILGLSPDFKFDSDRLLFSGRRYGRGGVVTLRQILPRPDAPAQYVYVEASSSPEGHHGMTLDGGEYDYVISERRGDGTRSLWRGFRDGAWRAIADLEYASETP